jgi:hypothetical protein
MTLSVFAFVWYLSLIVLAAAEVWNGHRRRRADEAMPMDQSYEDRRRRDRAEHLSRLREEELAQMRRSERAGRDRVRWPSLKASA